MKFQLAIGALVVGVACTTSSPGTTASTTDGGVPLVTSCSSSCETGDWPRLIVGLVSPIDASTAQATLPPRAIDASGRVWPATKGGCPKVNNFICSYSWSTNPSDRTMKVEVELDDGQIVNTEIDLAPHNFCARRIAYVELYLGTPVRFTAPRYISPCSDLL